MAANADTTAFQPRCRFGLLPFDKGVFAVVQPADEGLTMRYLCLIYLEDDSLRTQSQAELEACMAEQSNYFAKLESQGYGVAAHSLQPPETATCLRVRDGKLSMTDGPFAETSEQFGGFFLIDARDLNEAIRIASQIPIARYGCVEVRPLR